MRVLMLGWEFPPHISGGLGTACLGLTQGLAALGVKVRFVIPRAEGDEDAEHLEELIGCNRVPVAAGILAGGPMAGAVAAVTPERSATVAGAGAPGPATEAKAPPAGAAAPAEPPPGFESVVVDCLLRPYWTEAVYPGGRAPGAGAAAAGRLQETLLALLDGRAELLPGLAPKAGAAAATGPAREPVAAGRATLPFSGRYGPDLFEEVARYALVVAEIAAGGGFDLIHSHDWMTTLAGAAARRVSGRPLVCHVHATEYDRSGEHPNPRVQALEQLGLDHADRICCVSHYTAGVLRRRYRVDPRKLRVVHNAVTHEEQARDFHWRKAIPEPIVLFLGRVTFQKGPDYFIDAAAKVARAMPGVKFVMSGSGDMLPAMIERAARLGIARNIHFTGFLRGKDVERMYAMADLYVMPSVSEPFGISPLEAMALDVPVIVSKQSGVSEILSNALKVDFWDVDGLADKILALLRRPALRRQLIEEGRDEVRRMRWEARAAVVRDVYRELVA
ncbi:MAG: glycosyltransferase [Planctomycetota bacterium]|nr:MAG: glycosyltransferase [Planctomycetota bacterium]